MTLSLSARNHLRSRHLARPVQQRIYLREKTFSMRQDGVLLERRCVHPPRMDIEQSWVPHRPKQMKTQPPSPRPLSHAASQTQIAPRLSPYSSPILPLLLTGIKVTPPERRRDDSTLSRSDENTPTGASSSSRVQFDRGMNISVLTHID